MIVLECPKCSRNFEYECETADLPEKILCPECGKHSEYHEFHALLKCSQCHVKIAVPLDLLHQSELCCPQCDTPVDSGSIPTAGDRSDSVFTFDGNTYSRNFKRMLKDGEIFGKYRITRLLGQGGMAEVYLAEHLLMKTPCALKLMRESIHSDDPLFVKRFLREAKLSHVFNHPNIVRVYDVGSDLDTGYFFIAMEYVDGKNLLELAREHTLSESELKAVILSIADALKCLAEANVVHRDIKPSNIMLDKNGNFKLMDLGIAKSESNHSAGEMTLTMDRSTVGTPSYASPEQCRSSHFVDIRSDIYSLGATIYHAASGKLPFGGTTVMETILNVLHNNPEPLRKLRPDLSEQFLELVEQMMKKIPEERPASPDAVISSLKNSSSGTTENQCGHVDKKTGFNVFERVLQIRNIPVKYWYLAAVGIILAVAAVGIIKYFSGKGSISSSTSVPAAAVVQSTVPAAEPVAKNDVVVAAIPPEFLWGEPDFILNDQLEYARSGYQKFVRQYKSWQAEQNSVLSRLSPSHAALYGQIMAMRQNLLSSWKKRLQYLEKRNGEISAARNRSYDEHSGNLLRNAIGKYVDDGESDSEISEVVFGQRRNQWFSGRLKEYKIDILDLLEKKSVDPNLEVTFPQGKRALLNIIAGQAPGFYDPILIQKLCECKVDPSCLAKKGLRDIALFDMIFYGLPRFQVQNCFDKIFASVPKDDSGGVLEDDSGGVLADEYEELLSVETRKSKLFTLLLDGAAADIRHLNLAVCQGDKELVMLLLAIGVDPNGRMENGETVLFNAYRISDGGNIRELLLAAGADPEIKNRNGKKAGDFVGIAKFISCWEKNDLVQCRKMLEAGFDPDMILSGSGNFLLCDAIEKERWEACRMLLEFKADPNVRNSRGETPLGQLLSSLHQKRGQEIKLAKDLIKSGADIHGNISQNASVPILQIIARRSELLDLFLFTVKNSPYFTEQDWRFFRLSSACGFGTRFQADVVREILAMIPDDYLYAHDISGAERMFLAFLSGHKLDVKKTRKFLISSRAPRSSKLVENRGYSHRVLLPGEKQAVSLTLLHAAVYGRQPLEIIQMLLDEGFDPQKRISVDGKNAIDLAGDEKVREFLRNYRK